ncbi:YveK family protein [Clostridium algidicarnis]|uniref:Lipopolysaccharide biosynthesis protein n=1 Tax=Clostridium algidicarnis TaxID=37659 RepID=A0ABS6C361_9CLOT|nr:Wzz/FepE/Etk N-terminal domain-containing protein [Clostridium algidicarnis]MBB6631219.1 lipopolysaccharide biosynthesis protein [Clostridium algidicarnis]MBB6696129.1 lipopolysaccharide biosynthesis protein [Clostridium algidicarnis]MBU3193869.1 lipopolysaccharide biosynthesis protein [Clostridium algidicarnis]MBU3203251.1 lipopolysaccharide biosynthesis protein [Clostridium algidicarnis]MBU3205455.1 lipopolysaccharide biosynthesis protein [Clostridium algidicarnis]
MELKEYFFIIKKRIKIIIGITLLATILSAVISIFIIKPTYKSDISVIIGKSEVSESQNQNQNYNDVIMYQKMVKTYSEFAKSRTVSEDVIEKLKLEVTPSELLSMITVAPKGDTEFLTITVKAKDPEEARKIANQIALSLKSVSKEAKKADNVQLLDEASLPSSKDSPKIFLNIIIALFLGVMVSIGLVFIIEYLDNTVKTQQDIEKLLEIPVIGIIPLTEEER